MFTPEDILILSKAGFNAQQIAGLSMIRNNPAPAPAPDSATAPAPAPAPAPVDPVLQELQKLTGLMQMQNINNINQPPKTETPEDILASIINPPIKKE